MKWVAFLRAINVGGRTVRMERLRELFTSMGFGAVETVLASGNVIFETAPRDVSGRELERLIEPGLRVGLGFDVDTFVRSLANLRQIVDYEPFPRFELDTPTNDLYVTFLREPPPEDVVSGVLALRSAVDDVYIRGAELYWLRRRALGETVVYGSAIENILGTQITTRNIKTLRRLAAKYA